MRAATEAKKRRTSKELDAFVLALIAQSERPMTAYSIVRESARADFPLLPVQVYRSLTRLKSGGHIVSVATLNAFVPSRVDAPMHLLCTDCGAAELADASEAHALLDKICQSKGFATRTPHLELSGHCANCA